MEFKILNKNDLFVQAKKFTPKLPELVSIDFSTATVTVLDNQNQKHDLPFSDVEICEIIDPKATI